MPMSFQVDYLEILVPAVFGIMGLGVALARRRTGFNLPATAVILGVALCILSYVLIDGQADRIRDIAEKQKWPVVMGVITKSRVVGHGPYYPEISFTYQVGRKSYECVRSFPNLKSGSKLDKYKKAQTIVEEFPPGKQVNVWYNPSNPHDAYLRVEVPFRVYGVLGIGGLAFGAGVFFVVATMFGKRRPYRPL